MATQTADNCSMHGVSADTNLLTFPEAFFVQRGYCCRLSNNSGRKTSRADIGVDGNGDGMNTSTWPAWHN